MTILEMMLDADVAKTPPVRVIPREQTPASELRRHAIGMLRELAKQYPKEYREIGRELGLTFSA